MQFAGLENTDVGGNFGQPSHRFGPSNGFVDSWQVRIAPFER